MEENKLDLITIGESLIEFSTNQKFVSFFEKQNPFFPIFTSMDNCFSIFLFLFSNTISPHFPFIPLGFK